MFEGTKITIQKVDGEGYQAEQTITGNVERVHAFENFRNLIRHLSAVFGHDAAEKDAFPQRLVRGGAMIMSHDADTGNWSATRQPEMTLEEMRDELGELRRFKERAIERDEQKQKKLEAAIGQAEDFRQLAARHARRTEEVVLENTALTEKLARRKKRSR